MFGNDVVFGVVSVICTVMYQNINSSPPIFLQSWETISLNFVFYIPYLIWHLRTKASCWTLHVSSQKP